MHDDRQCTLAQEPHSGDLRRRREGTVEDTDLEDGDSSDHFVRCDSLKVVKKKGLL